VTVLVVGATGFVGSHLCRELFRRGATVRGTYRSATSPLPEGVVPARVADLTDVRALTAAMEGVSSVVHLAARVHVMRETAVDSLAAFRAVNVDGTRAVCDAALRAGVKRLVYLSSIKVNGNGKEGPYVDSDPEAPEDPYGISKLEAEARVKALSGTGCDWTIIRPPLVYGPGVGGNFQRLLRLADLSRRVPLPLGGIPNSRSMVFVGNLVDLIVRCLDDDSARERVCLVADEEAPSTSHLVERLAFHLGGESRLLPCPIRLLRIALAALGRSAEGDRLFGSLSVQPSMVGSPLVWRPPFTMDDGLRSTAQWWSGKREDACSS
jgi:nucleoside-diphosphate-sugar epimerase